MDPHSTTHEPSEPIDAIMTEAATEQIPPQPSSSSNIPPPSTSTSTSTSTSRPAASTLLPPPPPPTTTTATPQLPNGHAPSPTTASAPASAPVPAPSQIPTKPTPHGAPARRYLNEKVTGVLLEGMKILAAEQPEDPLRVLGEFLVARGREVEG
ncbi:hypothetical protein MMC09_001463 [Bachmanniomyces sp. S44760]|nr:hypothetical protein [Bachmanniomyces sp. S44760]